MRADQLASDLAALRQRDRHELEAAQQALTNLRLEHTQLAEQLRCQITKPLPILLCMFHHLDPLLMRPCHAHKQRA